MQKPPTEEQQDFTLTDTAQQGSVKVDKVTNSVEKRRQHQLQSSSYYERLTLAQKFSAAELAQYGYLLKYIRGEGIKSLAIFVLDGQVATVDFSGEIDLTPRIQLRR